MHDQESQQAFSKGLRILTDRFVLGRLHRCFVAALIGVGHLVH